MDITPATMRAVYTGLSTAFNARLGAAAPLFGRVAMTVPSTTAANEYPRLDDLPGMREWVGERVVHSLSAQTYTVRNREFEATISVKRSQIEDDQLGILNVAAAQLGQETAEFPDQLVFGLFNQGGATLCYDGQYFFDTDHPGFDENGATISVANYTAGAGASWYLIDDTKVIKPMIFQDRRKFKLVRKDQETDDNVFNMREYVYGVDGRCNAGFGLWQLAHKSKATLDAAGYAAARQAMTTIRKRNGQPIAITPKLLLVPPSLEGAARQLLTAEQIGGTTNIWRSTAEMLVVPQLQ